jgi:hypothetical protein
VEVLTVVYLFRMEKIRLLIKRKPKRLVIVL